MFNTKIISIYLNDFFNKCGCSVPAKYEVTANGGSYIKIHFYNEIDLSSAKKQADFAQAIKKICAYIEFKALYCCSE